MPSRRRESAKLMKPDKTRDGWPACSSTRRSSARLPVLSRFVAWALLSAGMVSNVRSATEDIAKYADPHVRVTQLMEGGGLVIVSSLNLLPNGELLAITSARQDHAAALGVKFAGGFGVVGRISKDSGQTWGRAFAILDSPADGSRTASDPTTVVAGGRAFVIVSMAGRPAPPFDWGDLQLWQVLLSQRLGSLASWRSSAHEPAGSTSPSRGSAPAAVAGSVDSLYRAASSPDWLRVETLDGAQVRCRQTTHACPANMIRSAPPTAPGISRA